jgi:hypothetical protein
MAAMNLYGKINYTQIDAFAGVSMIGPAYGANLHIPVTEKYLLSARYLNTQSVLLWSVEEVDEENLTDASLMISYRYDRKLILSSGIGYVLGTKIKDQKEHDFNSFSLPVNLYFEMFSFKHAGIGLNFFATINPQISTTGLSLALSFKL